MKDQLIHLFYFTFFVGSVNGPVFSYYNFEENKFFVKAFDRKVDLSKHETDDHLLPRKVGMNINKNIIILDIPIWRV